MSYTGQDDNDSVFDRPIRAYHLVLLIGLFIPAGVAVRWLI